MCEHGCVTCCSISSMFSTSRTTLVCTMDVDTPVWKPIDRLLQPRREGVAKIGAALADDTHEQAGPLTCVG